MVTLASPNVHAFLHADALLGQAFGLNPVYTVCKALGDGSLGISVVCSETGAKQWPEKEFLNPLKDPLPDAPNMKIFCMYGVGAPAERSYHYQRVDDPMVGLPLQDLCRICQGVQHSNIQTIIAVVARTSVTALLSESSHISYTECVDLMSYDLPLLSQLAALHDTLSRLRCCLQQLSNEDKKQAKRDAGRDDMKWQINVEVHDPEIGLVCTFLCTFLHQRQQLHPLALLNAIALGWLTN